MRVLVALFFVLLSANGFAVPLEEMDEEVADMHEMATSGDAEAQYGMGVCYLEGEDIPQDLPEAAAWFRKSADQGNIEAQASLAEMYLTGEGVPKDLVQACLWFRLAGQAEKCEPLVKQMTRDQVQEAERLFAEHPMSRIPAAQRAEPDDPEE